MGFAVGIVLVFVGLAGIFGPDAGSSKGSGAAFGVVLLVLGSVTTVVSGGMMWGNWFCSDKAAIPELTFNAADARDQLEALGFEDVRLDGGDKAVIVASNWSVRGSDPSEGVDVCKKDTVTLNVTK